MAKTNTVRPVRSLATTEARTALPEIVKEMVAISVPGESIIEHAVEVGPRHRGGVLIVPTVDAEAAMQREDEMRSRIEELEDELENIGIGLVLSDRLPNSSGSFISAADFARDLGFEDLAADMTD